jgi:hypothetical protein
LNRTRVALVALPSLMQDLVRRACQADCEIEVGPSIESLSELTRDFMREIDVVIAGVRTREDADRALTVLALRPPVRVLLIAAQDGVAELFALRPQRTRLGAVTPADIVSAVRDTAPHAAAWAGLGGPSLEGAC